VDTVEHKMKFKAVVMTPEFAAELLKHNHASNRRMKWNKINQYARDMEMGFWKLTHQGIAIDQSGDLVDGQNRLQAVIESGCSVPMLLVTGVPTKAMAAADQMAARSVADTARVLGKAFGKQETGYASAARFMMLGFNFKRKGITHQEIVAFAERHKQALDFAFEHIAHNKRGLTPAPLRAVIARAWYRRGYRTRLKEFCEAILSGLVNNREKDSAAIRLRNWLMDALNMGGFRNQIYAKCEEALSLFLDGLPCERLGTTKVELFPIPDDPSAEEDEIVAGKVG
jgi:hypothetical protein